MPTLPTSLAEISMEFPTLPADTPFPARITESSMGKSKKTNVDMLTLEFEVEDPDSGVKVKCWEYYTFQTKDGKTNESGLRALKRLVAAIFGEETANDPGFDTDNLKDVNCIVVLKLEEEENQQGENELRNRIKKVMGPA